MKYLATLLLIFGFGLSGFGQTIKSLGFNTTNGQVVAALGTNRLIFTNEKIGINEFTITGRQIDWQGYPRLDLEAAEFYDVWTFQEGIMFESTNASAVTRTNLGLGWSALTNTNAATSLLGVTTNGQVVANTGTNVLTFTNNETQFFSITLQEPSVSPITLDPSGGSLYVYDDAEFVISFGDGSIAAGAPITFADINGVYDATIAAATRANLGFSTNLNTLWTATNASTARSAVGLGETSDVTFGDLTIGSQRMTNAGGYYSILTMRESQNGASAAGFMGNASTNPDQRFIGFFTDGNSEPMWKVQAGALRLGRSNFGNVFFQSPFTFDNTTNAATTRTNLGLGGGITTNRTFVSYDGTNYTTNTVTISNGIITGWTQ